MQIAEQPTTYRALRGGKYEQDETRLYFESDLRVLSVGLGTCQPARYSVMKSHHAKEARWVLALLVLVLVLLSFLSNPGALV